MNSIAIIGASANREKFGNKAVRAYAKKGWKVFPINPTAEEIEGLKCYPSVLEIKEDVSIASLYLPPEVGIRIISELSRKGIERLYLNPGTESEELIKKCKRYGIQP
ncbi:CoA-binding protein, partial [Candidatus Woesearchaeota archaeon]|nr:CoA-binding protein [Candidatus Woesearchaeota archaeon]